MEWDCKGGIKPCTNKYINLLFSMDKIFMNASKEKKKDQPKRRRKMDDSG